MTRVRRSGISVLILSFLTCGIYYYYWIYVTSRDVNNELGGQAINPGMALVLSLFTCGIYPVFWAYKISKLIAELQAAKGVPVKDDSVICLILALVFMPAVGIIVQENLNKIP